jgi:hypothetical protein
MKVEKHKNIDEASMKNDEDTKNSELINKDSKEHWKVTPEFD